MSTKMPAPITEGIGRLTEQRGIALDLAARLQGKARSGELGTAVLEEARTYYVSGQAAIEGWIQQATLLAETGEGRQALATTEEALQHANIRAYAFVEFATNALAGDQVMGVEVTLKSDLRS